ncbi:hypothetical protein [Thalassotalea aquiviva]|uniref:hypothetical protein n=1 Tax=Thalassotalea aquiviva TaxID=3242415 RepID=UPI00352BC892
MKIKTLRSKFATLASVFVFSALANQAYASTTAKATIFNEVQVSYQAPGSSTDIIALSSVQVTVQLIKAYPSVSVPSYDPANPQSSTTGTVGSIFKVTSNANGEDTYPIALTPGTNTNLDGITVAAYLTDATRNPTGDALTDVTLGSAIITGGGAGFVTVPYVAKDPNGYNGLKSGDFVTISGTEYQINTITDGAAVAPSTVTDTGISKTPEQQVQISFVGHDTTNFGSTGLDYEGLVLGETQYIYVQSSAVNESQGAQDITNVFSVGVTASTDPDAPDTSGSQEIHNDIVTFYGINLNLTKLVQVVAPDGTFNPATTAYVATTDSPTAYPGDTLHYLITMDADDTNATASKVVITDALPLYTTLVKDAKSITVTYQKYDPITSPAATVATNLAILPDAGDSFETEDTGANINIFVTVGSDGNLTVNLGEGATASAGGKVSAQDTVAITYSVIVE